MLFQARDFNAADRGVLVWLCCLPWKGCFRQKPMKEGAAWEWELGTGWGGPQAKVRAGKKAIDESAEPTKPVAIQQQLLGDEGAGWGLI